MLNNSYTYVALGKVGMSEKGPSSNPDPPISQNTVCRKGNTPAEGRAKA